MIYIFYKLLSESLLSLYPIFVKMIKLPLSIQLWSRFITYIFISSFFVNWNFIKNNIISKWSLLLFIITMIHVYTSYRGFQLLESGVSYAIFYTYPIFILLFANTKINPIIILTIIGVYLLAFESYKKNDNEKNIENYEKKNDNEKNIENYEENNSNETIKYEENFKYEGIIMMLLASITEALIYYIVRNIKTENSWNHLFISYGFGTILFTIYNILNKNSVITLFKDITISKKITMSLIINALIGLFGYLLRIKSMYNLSPNIYAPLSYFGILIAFVYGIFINNEQINFNKIIGTLLIIISNLYILFN
jgi:drug/metabolite transporter (DMT)-like permease